MLQYRTSQSTHATSIGMAVASIYYCMKRNVALEIGSVMSLLSWVDNDVITFLFYFILFWARNKKKKRQMVSSFQQIKNIGWRKFVLHNGCICMVNKMILVTCCTALLVLLFHGCRLVEGFVAVRRFREPWDVLTDDKIEFVDLLQV